MLKPSCEQKARCLWKLLFQSADSVIRLSSLLQTVNGISHLIMCHKSLMVCSASKQSERRRDRRQGHHTANNLSSSSHSISSGDLSTRLIAPSNICAIPLFLRKCRRRESRRRARKDSSLFCLLSRLRFIIQATKKRPAYLTKDSNEGKWNGPELPGLKSKHCANLRNRFSCTHNSANRDESWVEKSQKSQTYASWCIKVWGASIVLKNSSSW